MARRSSGRRSYWSYWGGESVQEPKPSAKDLRARLGRAPKPVRGEGRVFTDTFWGRAWCDNLESYHDYANRLPRGRTYLRKGKVLDLSIARGHVSALVFGSSLYEINVKIGAVASKRWSALRKQCAGGLSSVIELLEGRIGEEVMEAVIAPSKGLFPEPRDIRLGCSCPDRAVMCKHVAAALYGVGVRLDERPELLFELRGVDPEELVSSSKHIVGEVASDREIEGGLSELFGVEIEEKKVAKKKVAKKKVAKKKVAKKKTATINFVMTRAQLLARGLAASTIEDWLRRRMLRPTERIEVYTLNQKAQEGLDAY